MIIEGSVQQEDAMGLNDDLKEKGFALLCVAYPKSDLHIIVGDEVEDNLSVSYTHLTLPTKRIV